jgi:hypothetical protein
MLSSISKTQAPLNNTCANVQEIVLPSPGERICVSDTTVGVSATFRNSFWICSGNCQDVWYTVATRNNIESYVDFIRGTIGNGVEINFFSQCSSGGYINFEGYYQFKQVDFDGEFEYFEFKVYPNPVEDALIIKLINVSSNEVQLNLFDVTSRLIFSSHSKLENTTDLIFVDVPNLHTGQYLLEISSSSEILTKRIIKK